MELEGCVAECVEDNRDSHQHRKRKHFLRWEDNLNRVPVQSGSAVRLRLQGLAMI